LSDYRYVTQCNRLTKPCATVVPPVLVSWPFPPPLTNIFLLRSISPPRDTSDTPRPLWPFVFGAPSGLPTLTRCPSGSSSHPAYDLKVFQARAKWMAWASATPNLQKVKGLFSDALCNGVHVTPLHWASEYGHLEVVLVPVHTLLRGVRQVTSGKLALRSVRMSTPRENLTGCRFFERYKMDTRGRERGYRAY
jgi:hypothetical protein